MRSDIPVRGVQLNRLSSAPSPTRSHRRVLRRSPGEAPPSSPGCLALLVSMSLIDRPPLAKGLVVSSRCDTIQDDGSSNLRNPSPDRLAGSHQLSSQAVLQPSRVRGVLSLSFKRAQATQGRRPWHSWRTSGHVPPFAPGGKTENNGWLFICHGRGRWNAEKPRVANGRHVCLRPSCPSSRTEKADAFVVSLKDIKFPHSRQPLLSCLRLLPGGTCRRFPLIVLDSSLCRGKTREWDWLDRYAHASAEQLQPRDPGQPSTLDSLLSALCATFYPGRKLQPQAPTKPAYVRHHRFWPIFQHFAFLRPRHL